MKYTPGKPESLPNGQTRTVVTFVATDGGEYHEDFITNRQPVGSRVVTDEAGRWKLAGARDSWIHPDDMQPGVDYEFERETFSVDMVAVFEENINRFLLSRKDDGTTNAERIEAGLLKGDNTSSAYAKQVLPEPAPHLRSAAVLAFADKEVEVPVDRARVEALRRERGR